MAARSNGGAVLVLDRHQVELALESRAGAVQRGGQSCWATSGDEQVDHVRLASAAFSTLIRVLSSAAFSTVKTTAVIHAVCTNGSATPSATTAT